MTEQIVSSDIQEWRSIITLIIFVITNIIVLFPFHLPIYVPRLICDGILDVLSALRIISTRRDCSTDAKHGSSDNHEGRATPFVRLNFPLGFVTAPLIADLFLLAISAIGRQEVLAGTIGANNIQPIDIMAFFFTLAYIAISIDASGLIRFLAFKVLQWGGEVGHRLFFYLYAFFFVMGSFIGNDPIILSGTAFLAYMTRVSSNIIHPRAWIYTQFAIANIASAILVSSNPTNLVLAGAFNIKFIDYTANMIVPVVFTAIVLFPFLLYIVFADEALIPLKIEMHQLPEEKQGKEPVNPNIPHARGTADEEESNNPDTPQDKLLSLEEIVNPFVDKGGAAFGAVIMAATLITLLALNASGGEHPVFYVTLPAAFVMFCWDLGFGWYHREKTREIARVGRLEVERARAERAVREEDNSRALATQERVGSTVVNQSAPSQMQAQNTNTQIRNRNSNESKTISNYPSADEGMLPTEKTENQGILNVDSESQLQGALDTSLAGEPKPEVDLEERIQRKMAEQQARGRATLVSLVADAYYWSQKTFPTCTAVLAHLPFALVPFAFAMFVLVEALVSKGWVNVFAHGWRAWVDKTGTIGAIGGMGFLSVLLCNFAGTNIGTTILLSRVIQAWLRILKDEGNFTTDRTLWATVYSMALGVNYGAFSTAFSASLAGLLWRHILERKFIHVRRLEFARVNIPIIAISMTVGCAVLTGEVYIMRGDNAFVLAGE
ncbi:putative arsenite efflux transporter ArsB-like protein [Podospora appendiculata]|uniref:Arsenite efflux transporter ArsB-like protein n=1 Tax=Podospora appendiculata TaxID=314037 RepID=A0AAE1CFW3_9PEZI|nr:putative arsenite efflux transporter ArsB-like protein [Podospora appendiculata]